MTVELSAEDFRKLVQIVSSLDAFGFVRDRKRLTANAFEGTPRAADILSQIDFDGPPGLAASELIRKLSQFGRIAEGKEGLAIFLEDILKYKGDEDEDAIFIQGLFASYAFDTRSRHSEKSAPFLPHDLQERIDSTGARQVWVPHGRFLRGSDRQRDQEVEDDELPQHEVYISRDFWLDMHPVTNAMYQRFTLAGGYCQEHLWSQEGWEWLTKNKIKHPKLIRNFDEPDMPRVGVSWYEADAYARWRGGRLPTEAEWEYAARGPKSLIYPWGNEYDATRLNIDNRHHITTVVLRYSGDKSWIGAYDMAGNVAEWVADCYEAIYYKERPYQDPQGPESKSNCTRVIRGGSWRSKPTKARAAHRDHYNPEFSDNNIGFRVACDSEQGT